jgi:hypothetical protein
MHASTPCKTVSPKVYYSPAKRSHEDFAAVHSTDSDVEEPVIPEIVTKRLKTGSGDASAEESEGSGSNSEEETSSNCDEVHHEIDGANEGENPSEDDDDEEDEDLTCVHCGGTPCIWQQLGPEIVALGDSRDWLNSESDNHAFNVTNFDGKNEQELKEKHLEHKHRCYESFCTFNGLWSEGGRGRGDRHKAPHCVDCEIHLIYPVPPGFTRTGFIPVAEDS